jgi:hypothetical protein
MGNIFLEIQETLVQSENFAWQNWLTYGGVLLTAVNGIFLFFNTNRAEAQKQQITLSISYKENLDSEIKKNLELVKENAALKLQLQKSEDESAVFRKSYTSLTSDTITEVIRAGKLMRERDALKAECEELHSKVARQTGGLNHQ